MNKYALLVIINSPLIVFAVLMAVTSYKTGRSTKRCRWNIPGSYQGE